MGSGALLANGANLSLLAPAAQGSHDRSNAAHRGPDALRRPDLLERRAVGEAQRSPRGHAVRGGCAGGLPGAGNQDDRLSSQRRACRPLSAAASNLSENFSARLKCLRKPAGKRPRNPPPPVNTVYSAPLNRDTSLLLLLRHVVAPSVTRPFGNMGGTAPV